MNFSYLDLSQTIFTIFAHFMVEYRLCLSFEYAIVRTLIYSREFSHIMMVCISTTFAH